MYEHRIYSDISISVQVLLLDGRRAAIIFENLGMTVTSSTTWTYFEFLFNPETHCLDQKDDFACSFKI